MLTLSGLAAFLTAEILREFSLLLSMLTRPMCELTISLWAFDVPTLGELFS